MTSSGRLGCVGLEEGRDLGGVVLSVGVERDDRIGAGIDGVPEALAQRGALALVRKLADDVRAGGLGLRGGVIGGPVVHDDDREKGPRPLHDGGDARTFLIAGDQREDGVHA